MVEGFDWRKWLRDLGAEARERLPKTAAEWEEHNRRKWPPLDDPSVVQSDLNTGEDHGRGHLLYRVAERL